MRSFTVFLSSLFFYNPSKPRYCLGLCQMFTRLVRKNKCISLLRIDRQKVAVYRQI